jgi:FCP1-like phosphatase family protein
MTSPKRPVCDHDSVWMGLCAKCGDKIVSEDEGDVGHEDHYIKAGFVSMDHGFKVKRACAVRMEAETVQVLTAAKKCVLVFDLDHTLVHVTINDPDSHTNVELLADVFAAGATVGEDSVYRFTDGRSVYHMKVRPGAIAFLEHAKSRFQLYVYTHGTLEYASVVLRALDPQGELFGSPPRLIAREGQRVEHKSLHKIFPTEHKLVLILDDRSDVWLDADNNLVQVTPYLFFSDGDRSRIGLEASCPPLKPLGWEGDHLDCQLAILQPLLDGLVAATYFAAGDTLTEVPDVRPHLQALRESVLKDMKITTSGMIPMDTEDPLSHPVSTALRSLGAISALDDDVDILVTPNEETRRARELAKRGVAIVHPWFLLHALSTLTRPAIEPFLVTSVLKSEARSHWEVIGATRQTDTSAEAEDLLDDLLSYSSVVL